MIQSFLRIIFVHTADRAQFYILPDHGGTTSSMIGTSVLTFLGYPYVTDIDIAKNQIF